MRIRLTLRDWKLVSYLPINTNYYLARLLDMVINRHKDYLQSLIPHHYDQGRKFDLFTFSQLIIPTRSIEHNRIAVYSSELYWYICSPYHQFISILAREFRLKSRIKIASNTYIVSQFEYLEHPLFSTGDAKFTCLSPITLTRDTESKFEDRSASPHFLLPDNAEYSNRMIKETCSKLTIITNNKINRIKFSLEYDKKYIQRKNNKISKLIAIEKNKQKPQYIRAVFAPLKISTTPDILTLIYDAGLGSYNAMGFGMIRQIQGSNPGSL